MSRLLGDPILYNGNWHNYRCISCKPRFNHGRYETSLKNKNHHWSSNNWKGIGKSRPIAGNTPLKE